MGNKYVVVIDISKDGIDTKVEEVAEKESINEINDFDTEDIITKEDNYEYKTHTYQTRVDLLEKIKEEAKSNNELIKVTFNNILQKYFENKNYYDCCNN